MTIVNLHTAAPTLSDLLAAVTGLNDGVRVGVRDQLGNIYRVDTLFYDSARMALVLQVDTTKPIVLPAV